jgi:peptide/nickel transport system permease protein
MSETFKPAPPPPPRAARMLDDNFVSFWDIVRRQFMRNRTAVFALRSLMVLIVLAIFAPLIALNIPYVISYSGELQFPIFIHLFDGHVFQSGVDMFFNLLMVVVPFWWLTSGLVRNLEQGRRTAALLHGVPLALITLFYSSLAIHYWRLGADDEAWQGPARVIYIKLLGTAGLGVLLMLATRFLSRRLGERERRRKFARMRMILLAIIGVTLYLSAVGAEFEGQAGRILNPITSKWSYTSSVPIYRKDIAELRKNGKGWAICPPIFFHPTNANDDPNIALGNRLHAPEFSNGTILGCDLNGRDVLTRLLYGTRISLTIGIVAVSIYVSIGIFMGSLAGYFGGRMDMLIMFALQVLMCIPTMFLLLTIIALFDSRSIFIIMVAIGVTGWTGVARLVRGEFFRQRSIDYVAAAKALGVPERKIIFNHILKNSIGPVLVSAAFGVAGAVLTESFLAFLGLGDTTAPSWGQVLRAGQDTRKAWLLYSPGLAIFYLVTVLNIIGEGLRDALDPKLRT